MARKINVDISRWHNNDAEESNDRWAYRGTTDGQVNGVYESDDDYYYGYNGMETELEGSLWAVYAEYMTGDTFGSDYEACVVGLFNTEEEAFELMDEAEKFSGYGQLSNGFYPTWTGYFERLISLNVTEVNKKTITRRY